MGLLKNTVRPEFLNRIDDIVLFKPLSESDIQQIVRLQVSLVCDRLAKQGVNLIVDDAAVACVAREGYDPQFGARPVKRALQRMLLNPLSHALLAGTVSKDTPISISERQGELVFGN
jgi:ATP-dependent Clp protease ATP-binding subunit ClpB